MPHHLNLTLNLWLIQICKQVWRSHSHNIVWIKFRWCGRINFWESRTYKVCYREEKLYVASWQPGQSKSPAFIIHINNTWKYQMFSSILALWNCGICDSPVIKYSVKRCIDFWSHQVSYKRTSFKCRVEAELRNRSDVHPSRWLMLHWHGNTNRVSRYQHEAHLSTFYL